MKNQKQKARRSESQTQADQRMYGSDGERNKVGVNGM